MASEVEIAQMEWLKKKCLGKVQHRSYTGATYALDNVVHDKRKHLLEIYRCPVCNFLHIGHNTKNMDQQNTTDLQSFHQLFDHSKFKDLKEKGIEYRCIDLDATKDQAKELISKHGFKLEAVTEDDMAARRAFIVREVK